LIIRWEDAPVCGERVADSAAFRGSDKLVKKTSAWEGLRPAIPLEPPPGVPMATRLWRADLESVSARECSALEALLDPAEKARAARFRFERDRRRFVIARGILRGLLGEALGLPGEAVVFCYGRLGKPELAEKSRSSHSNPGTLRFNLSHSGGHAMFALNQNGEVGIDLEAGNRFVGRDAELASLATRVLTPRELAVWRALPDAAARLAAFLRAWTRKEAFGKATGEGVFDGLTHVEVALDAAAPQAMLRLSTAGSPELKIDREPDRESRAETWMIFDLPAPAGFAAALAVSETL
jgi:4'-phosphopantetheinyl transferase